MADFDDAWLEEILGKNPELSVDTGSGRKLPLPDVSTVFAHDRADVRLLASNPPPKRKFRSKTEKRAWDNWRDWVGYICPASDVVRLEYEMMSLKNLSGGVSYTADFFVLDSAGTLHIIDVKGSAGWRNHHGSGRSAVTAIKSAADTYYWVGKFYILYPKKGGWTVESVGVDGAMRLTPRTAVLP